MRVFSLLLKAPVVCLLMFTLNGCGGDNDSSESDTSTPNPPTQGDTTPPVITLNGEASASVYYAREYIEAGAKAVDAVDGEVTVSISGEVNIKVPAIYIITYTASDNSGNQSQQTRTVTVQEQRPFITTWDTRNEGASSDNQIKIDTEGEGFNYSVTWGDGQTDDNVAGDITHTYSSPGIYTIKITGDFPHFIMGQSFQIALPELDENFEPVYRTILESDDSKLLSIDQWGDIEWGSFNQSFAKAVNMEVNATDSPNFSEVTSVHNMFDGAISFNQAIDHWDVSALTNMNSMFEGATNFNQDIGSWNVSNVITMDAMFREAKSFNQPIGNWDVVKVTRMASMFSGATSFNQDIGNWNIGKVMDARLMFSGASNFNQNIGNWNTSAITNMSYMFSRATDFNQDISDWDVSNVGYMGNMFEQAASFNQDLSNWNVAKVTDMDSMFRATLSFNQDLSSWDVSSVTTMASMFSEATAFNQDISQWNVANVSSMISMFLGSTSFDQNLGNWNISNVKDMRRMFFQLALSTENYDATLLGWSSQQVPENIKFDAGNSKYSEKSAAARQSLIDQFNWAITDGGPVQ